MPPEAGGQTAAKQGYGTRGRLTETTRFRHMRSMRLCQRRRFMTTPTQRHIIDALNTKATIDPEAEVAYRVAFLQDYVMHTGRKGLVLSISGGQDSALAGRLCQLAVEKLRERAGEEYVFIALRLPYGIQQDEEDAQRA